MLKEMIDLSCKEYKDENGNIDCGLTGGHFTKDGQAHSDPTGETRFLRI